MSNVDHFLLCSDHHAYVDVHLFIAFFTLSERDILLFNGSGFISILDYRITLTFFMDAQQSATDMDMDLSDAVDVYLASWDIDEKWDDEDDWHSWSLIEWICDMVKEENDFVLAFLIEQHQLFTDDLTMSMQEEDASSIDDA